MLCSWFIGLVRPNFFVGRNLYASRDRCDTGDVEQVFVGEVFGDGVVTPATATQRIGYRQTVLDRTAGSRSARSVDDQTRYGEFGTGLDDVSLIVGVDTGSVSITLHSEVRFSDLDGLIEILICKIGHNGEHFFLANQVFASGTGCLYGEDPGLFRNGDSGSCCDFGYGLTDQFAVDLGAQGFGKLELVCFIRLLAVDMLKEVLNVITGNFLTELESANATVSLPFISQGKDHILKLPTIPVIAIPYISSFGPFLVLTGIVENPQAL